MLSQIVYMNIIDLTCYTVRLTTYQHHAKEQLTQFVELTHQRFDKKVSGQS